MRKHLIHLIYAVILCVFPHLAGAESTDTISFPNQNEPGILIVSGSGDVDITGYNGNEVRVTSEEGVSTSKAGETDEKARGLTKLTAHGFSMFTIEDKNAVVINRPIDDESDVSIQVPKQTRLIIGGSSGNESLIIKSKVKIEEKDDNKSTSTGTPPDPVVIPNFDVYSLSSDIVNNFIGAFLPFGISMNGILEGDITVTDIEGDIEVRANEGDIILKNITGTVSANNIEGDIEVVFDKVTSDKPMYFSTIEGDIDITLPASHGADIVMSTVEGDVYTGFNIANVNSMINDQSTNSIWVGSMVGTRISGTINGGGPEVSLKTVEGTIYLRKE